MVVMALGQAADGWNIWKETVGLSLYKEHKSRAVSHHAPCPELQRWISRELCSWCVLPKSHKPQLKRFIFHTIRKFSETTNAETTSGGLLLSNVKVLK